jgi:hypothetical protein
MILTDKQQNINEKSWTWKDAHMSFSKEKHTGARKTQNEPINHVKGANFFLKKGNNLFFWSQFEKHYPLESKQITATQTKITKSKSNLPQKSEVQITLSFNPRNWAFHLRENTARDQTERDLTTSLSSSLQERRI